MTSDTEKRIAALERIRSSLQRSAGEEGVPAPELLLARAIDLSRAAFPGEAMKEQIAGIEERRNVAETVQLIDEAIDSLRSDSFYELMQPDGAKQLQDYVAVALIQNKWIKLSIVGLFLLYAGAAALYLSSAGDIFGRAQFVARIAEKADQSVRQVEVLAAGIEKNIKAAEVRYDGIQERTDRIELDVSQIEATLSSRRMEFEGKVTTAEQSVSDAAAAVQARIGEAPAKADALAREAFSNAEGLAKERLAKMAISIEGLEGRIGSIDEDITALNDKVRKQVDGFNTAEEQLNRRIEASKQYFMAIPGRIDALFTGRDAGIDRGIGLLLASLEKKHDASLAGEVDLLVRRLEERSNQDEKIVEQKSKTAQARLDSLDESITGLEGRLTDQTNRAIDAISEWRGNTDTRFASIDSRLAELERAAGTLEQRRREDEAKYGAIRVFADQVRSIESRLDASDERIEAVNGKIKPAEDLLTALSDRSGSVAQLLGEAMAVGNEKIAAELWMVIKTNYAIFGLTVAVSVALAWLSILTVTGKRRRNPPQKKPKPA